MMFEDGHPIISPSDWQNFLVWQKSCKKLPSHLIDKVIGRNEAKLPDWFVPMARGVAIASNELLGRAGHRHGMQEPRGWWKTDRRCFARVINENHDFLVVRQADQMNLWTIERLRDRRRLKAIDEVLVHVFGSTPLVCRNYQSAMRLAMHCHVNHPPAGLGWIGTAPNNCEGAMEIARKRRIEEAIGANGAHPEGRLH